MKAKPFNKTKSIVTYVVCVILIVALAIGNYFAYLYKDLITVYTSGSDVVTTDESAKVCQTIEEEGMVLLKNDKGLPLKEGAKVSLLGEDSVDFVYGGAGSGSVDTSLALNLKKAMEKSGFESMRHFGTFTTKEQEKITVKVFRMKQARESFRWEKFLRMFTQMM